MPELCRFYGIVINIHFREHGPPHFHATYSGDRALIDIGNLFLLEGRLHHAPEASSSNGLLFTKTSFGKPGTGRNVWNRPER